ncbi:MAG TPA: hypothetical protein VIB08_01255 [Thermoanaerobaculia bacterium]
MSPPKNDSPSLVGPGPVWVGDSERTESLAELRDQYAEARNHVPTGEPHGNLDWILGARRNPERDPLLYRTGTIRLIALWLQDLASDLDRASERGTPEQKSIVAPAESLAGKLRDATKRFLTAFRNPN